MDKEKEYVQDIIDEDLYEEIDEDELVELVEQAREEALQKAKLREENKRKTPFPKWIFWVIAFAMFFNVFALLPQTFSIPAIDFLMTSAKLSAQENIKAYKKAIVVIETDEGRGTGFAFNSEGDILTNYHVIEGYDTVTVSFQEEGLLSGKVTDVFPDIDLAVIQVDEKNVPYLPLAQSFTHTVGEPIYFIGNPLKFNRIANQGTVIEGTHVSSKEKPVVMLDAPVYRGNSGSPVINENGEVIGVIFATMFHDSEGRVGLFIPIDYFYEAMRNE